MKCKVEFSIDEEKFLMYSGSVFDKNEFEDWLRDKLEDSLFISDVDINLDLEESLF